MNKYLFILNLLFSFFNGRKLTAKKILSAKTKKNKPKKRK